MILLKLVKAEILRSNATVIPCLDGATELIRFAQRSYPPRTLLARRSRRALFGIEDTAPLFLSPAGRPHKTRLMARNKYWRLRLMRGIPPRVRCAGG
jgi:hypothetical protein